MENKLMHYGQLSQESDGSKTGMHTSSILKPPKQREPLQELDFKLNTDEDGTTVTRTRRVSFHKAVLMKEFDIEEAVTVWGSTYEETFKSSDHADSSSGQSATSIITGFDHLLCSTTNTSIPGPRRMTRIYSPDSQRTRNWLNDESMDEEMCIPLNKMQICKQSTNMGLAEPLESSPQSVIDTGHWLGSAGSDLTETFIQTADLDLESHSQFLSELDHEFNRLDENDMELTEPFLDVQSRSKQCASQQTELITRYQKKTEPISAYIYRLGTEQEKANNFIFKKVQNKEEYNSSHEEQLTKDFLIPGSEVITSNDVSGIGIENHLTKIGKNLCNEMNDSELSFTEVVFNKNENLENFRGNELPSSNFQQLNKSSEQPQNMDFTELKVKTSGFERYFFGEQSVEHELDCDTQKHVRVRTPDVLDYETTTELKNLKLTEQMVANKTNLDVPSSSSKTNYLAPRGSLISPSFQMVDKNVLNIGSFSCTRQIFLPDSTLNCNIKNPLTSANLPYQIPYMNCEEKHIGTAIGHSHLLKNENDVELRKNKQILSQAATSVLTKTDNELRETKEDMLSKNGTYNLSESDSEIEIIDTLNYTSGAFNVVSKNSTNSDSDEELTNILKRDCTSNAIGSVASIADIKKVAVSENVSNMDLNSEIKQKRNVLLSLSHSGENLGSMDIGEVNNTGDSMIRLSGFSENSSFMDFTEGVKQKGNISRIGLVCSSEDVNNIDFTNGEKQKINTSIVRMLGSAESIGNMNITNIVKEKEDMDVSRMDFTSGIKQKENVITLGVSSMDFTSGIKRKDVHMVEISNFTDTNSKKQKGNASTLDVSSMDFTSGINQKDVCMVEISNFTDPNSKKQKENVNTLDVSSMDFTSGIKQKDVNVVEIPNFTYANSKKQKENASTLDVSSMDFTSGIKQKDNVSMVEISNFTDTNSKKQKKNVSTLDVSSMDFTSGIKQKDVSMVEMSNFTDANSKKQKENASTLDVSSMDFTSGIKQKDVNMVEMSNFTDANSKKQKENASTLDVSSMDFTSGIKQNDASMVGISNFTDPNSKKLKKNASTLDVSSMDFTSGIKQKDISMMEISNFTDSNSKEQKKNVSSMDFTSGIKQNDNVGIVEISNFTDPNSKKQKENARTLDISSMDFTSGIKLKDVSMVEIPNFTDSNSKKQKENASALDASSMDFTSGIKQNDNVGIVEISNFTDPNSKKQKENASTLDVSSMDFTSEVKHGKDGNWKDMLNSVETFNNVDFIISKRQRDDKVLDKLCSGDNINYVTRENVIDEGNVEKAKITSSLVEDVDNTDSTPRVTQDEKEIFNQSPKFSFSESVCPLNENRNFSPVKGHNQVKRCTSSESYFEGYEYTGFGVLHSQDDSIKGTQQEAELPDRYLKPSNAELNNSMKNVHNKTSSETKIQNSETALDIHNAEQRKLQEENDCVTTKLSNYSDVEIDVCKSNTRDGILDQVSVKELGKRPYERGHISSVTSAQDLLARNMQELDYASPQRKKPTLQNYKSPSCNKTRVSLSIETSRHDGDVEIMNKNLNLQQMPELSSGTCSDFITVGTKTNRDNTDNGSYCSHSLKGENKMEEMEVETFTDSLLQNVSSKSEDEISSVEDLSFEEKDQSYKKVIKSVKKADETLRSFLLSAPESGNTFTSSKSGEGVSRTDRHVSKLTSEKSKCVKNSIGEMNSKDSSKKLNVDFHNSLIESQVRRNECTSDGKEYCEKDTQEQIERQAEEQNNFTTKEIVEHKEQRNNTEELFSVNKPCKEISNINERKEEFDRTLVSEQVEHKEKSIDVTENFSKLSMEEQIRMKELRSRCEWKTKDFTEAVWSFSFLYKSLLLVLNLDVSVIEDKTATYKPVTDIKFMSNATEKSDPLVKFVHRVLLYKFDRSALKSLCKTSENVLETLETVSVETKKLRIFMKAVAYLEDMEMAKVENNCISFDVSDLAAHVWFRVKVKLDNWEDISPVDVSVENIIGTTSEEEVKHLVTGAARGPTCVKDYNRIIKRYVEILRKK